MEPLLDSNRHKIKVTGDFLTGSAYSADADFVDVPNFNTSQFTKQLAGPSTTSSEKFTYATPQPASFRIYSNSKRKE